VAALALGVCGSPVESRASVVITVCDQQHLESAVSTGGNVAFACDGTITLTNTISVTNNCVLDASGHAVTISGGDSVRIFNVGAGVAFTIINLEISHGQNTGTPGAPGATGLPGGDAFGGAISNAGNCTLLGTIFSGNMAAGGNGGANGGNGGKAFGGCIYNNHGALRITNCMFLSSAAAAGIGADTRSASIGSGTGGMAFGGAIYNDGGSLSFVNSICAGNSAQGGAGGAMTIVVPTGGVGGDANGGAIYSSIGPVVISGSTFNSNTVAAGGQQQRNSTGGLGGGGAVFIATGSLNASNTVFATNQVTGGMVGDAAFYPGFGCGGGIFNESATITVLGCSFLGNVAVGGMRGTKGGDGNGGGIFNNSLGTVVDSSFLGNTALGGTDGTSFYGVRTSGSGNGGAIYNGGTLTLLSSTVASNTAAGGTGTPYSGTYPGTGGQAFGGGIYNSGVSFITNLTCYGNVSAGGNGGASTLVFVSPGVAGSGFGGGIYNDGGSILLTHGTVAANSAIAGVGSPSGIGLGGGVFSTNNSVILRSSIVAYSTSGTNCVGTVTDGGSNISSDSSRSFASSGSLTNTDPVLGPLSDYGGPTLTMPLLAGSPAIDSAAGTSCPPTDQRGRTRPFGAQCDIGAFESSPPYTIGGKVYGYRPPGGIAVSIGANSSTVEADGNYAFNGFSSGSYTVIPAATNSVIVPTNQVAQVGPDQVHVDFRNYQFNTLSIEGWSSNQFRLVYAGDPGRLLRLEDSTNLPNWNPFLTNSVGSTGIFEILETNELSGPAARLFRSKQLP